MWLCSLCLACCGAVSALPLSGSSLSGALGQGEEERERPPSPHRSLSGSPLLVTKVSWPWLPASDRHPGAASLSLGEPAEGRPQGLPLCQPSPSRAPGVPCPQSAVLREVLARWCNPTSLWLPTLVAGKLTSCQERMLLGSWWPFSAAIPPQRSLLPLRSMADR